MEKEIYYIGRLNPVKRYLYITISVMCGIFAFFFLLMYSRIVAGISVILFVGILIYIIRRFDPDKNVLWFESDAIVFSEKPSAGKITYADIEKYEFIDQPRGQNFCRIKTIGKKVDHILDTKNGNDVDILVFADFLLSKNKSIEILHYRTNFETYKYFRNNDEIKRVLIN